MLACEDLKHGGVVHHGSLPAAAGLYGGSLYPQLGYLQLPASALDLPPSAQGPLGAMGPWSSGSGAGRGLGASPPSPPAVPAYNTTSNRGCPDPSTSGGHHSSDGVTAACKKPSNAQKRFRERQKEMMASLEREVSEKRAAFEVLAHENEQLKMRAQILEKVVVCREEQLGLLGKFHTCLESATAAPSSCFGAGSGAGFGTPDADAQEMERFQSLRRDDVVKEYKDFLSEVSGHLLRYELGGGQDGGPDDSAAGQQVVGAVSRFGYMMKHIVLLNPTLLRSLLSVNLESGMPATVPESHWQGVVASLALAPAQRHDVLAVFDLYRGVIAKVYEERRLIMAALGEGPGYLTRDNHISRNDLAMEMELTEKLQANLGKEQSSSTLLCCFFFGKVLEATQFAKLAVHSWPFFADSLAIASVVAQQCNYFGDQPNQQLLPSSGSGPSLLHSSSEGHSGGGQHR